MIVYKTIEEYVGRKVDFENEVVLRDDGNGTYIKEWNIDDKDEPTMQQLEDLWNSKQNKIEKDIAKEQFIAQEQDRIPP